MINETKQNQINGNEKTANAKTAIGALTEFYKAFNSGDIKLMKENWLNGDEAAMSNPLGGIKRGWNDIYTIYQSIFDGPADVYVEYYDYTVFEGRGYFQAIGKERGYFQRGDIRINLNIRTSRLFVMHDDRYRQLHHHGSIDDPKLLRNYQHAVFDN